MTDILSVFIKDKCIHTLDTAIKSNETFVHFNLHEWFTEFYNSTDFSYQRSFIDKLYCQLHIQYWNNHNILLYIGGCTGGSGVTIFKITDYEYDTVVKENKTFIKDNITCAVKNQKLSINNRCMSTTDKSYCVININDELKKYDLCLKMNDYNHFIVTKQ